jgi:hypothetical protein
MFQVHGMVSLDAQQATDCCLLNFLLQLKLAVPLLLLPLLLFLAAAAAVILPGQGLTFEPDTGRVRAEDCPTSTYGEPCQLLWGVNNHRHCWNCQIAGCGVQAHQGCD